MLWMMLVFDGVIDDDDDVVDDVGIGDVDSDDVTGMLALMMLVFLMVLLVFLRDVIPPAFLSFATSLAGDSGLRSRPQMY